jgi:ACS family glucarate transporter-like MFS transporter
MLTVALFLIFLGKGWSNSGWMLVADIAPPGRVGTLGGMLNAFGAIGGVATSLVIGQIVDRTGSFSLALIFIGAHGVLAVAAYWLVLKKLERMTAPER